MKKSLSLLLALALCLTSATALAAGKLNVVQENYYTIPGYSTYGYAYAKVENSGDKPIRVNAGVLEIYDESGDAITSADYLQAHAEYLQPGEYTYVEMYDEIEDPDVKVDDYMLTITGKSENDAVSKRLPCEVDLQMGVDEGWSTRNYVPTITNDTDQPLYDISVVLALLDAQGNILYMDDDSLYSERA